MDPEVLLARMGDKGNQPLSFQAQIYYEYKRSIIALTIIFLSVLLESCAFHTVIYSFIPIANDDPTVWSAVQTLDILTGVYLVQYFTAFITSWLSDTHIARFWTICGGYVIYIIGYAILVISQAKDYDGIQCKIETFVHHGPNNLNETSPELSDACSPILVTSLLIIGLGSGVLLGNIIIFGADQTNSAEVAPKFFHIQYWMMKFGAVISCYVIDYVEMQFFDSQFWPLLTALICLCLSLVVFVAGRRKYIYRERQSDMTQTLTKVISASFSEDTRRRRRRDREGQNA